MPSPADRIAQRQRDRYRMFRLVYEEAAGQEKQVVEFFKLASGAGIDEPAAEDAYNYLKGEGLLRELARGVVFLTHAGVQEMEASIEQPDNRTEHFSVPVIQQVTNNFYAPIGAVQTGAHSIANVSQDAGFSATDVLEMLKRVRENLHTVPAPQRAEVIECLEGVEEEAGRPAPSKTRMRAFVQAALPIVRSVSEQTAANILATLLTRLGG